MKPLLLVMLLTAGCLGGQTMQEIPKLKPGQTMTCYKGSVKVCTITSEENRDSKMEKSMNQIWFNLCVSQAEEDSKKKAVCIMTRDIILALINNEQGKF